MITFRRVFHLAPAALAGAALLMITVAAGGQTRNSAPAQAGPAARGPAATLASPATPTMTPGADGFIQRWLLLEPIPFNDLTEAAVRAGVKKEYFPNQFTVIPKDGNKVTVDGNELTWHAVDTKLYHVNLYHFAWALNKPTSNVLFWTVTIVNCPQEMPNVRLAIGC